MCISSRKGTAKTNVGNCEIIENFGLKGDAHAGSERQVSLLSENAVNDFRRRCDGKVTVSPGIFGENLLVDSVDLTNYPVGAIIIIGDVILAVTQIGKTCHSGCDIMARTGECIMPQEGVFAKVIRGGSVAVGDEVRIPYRAAVITASDRSYRKEREDKSGPAIVNRLEESGYYVGSRVLLPDDEDGLAGELARIADDERPDVIFTTGGTGLSERDRMPEATKRVADRDVPGIAEAIRAYSMKITPNAMLSRAVSVIRKKTLIVNLPGSPKAVEECLDLILPGLEHGLGILRGDTDG